MTTGEKALLVVTLGGALYLIFSRDSRGEIPPAEQPATINASTADRVMGFTAYMLHYGVEQGVDPALIASVITVESSGRPDARGTSGEIGLMQILPSTGQWIGNVDPAQLAVPATNIQVGTAYIRYSVDQKAGNVAAGIAGYNYGPGRVVIQGNRLVVPDVVRRYVDNVLSLVEPYRALFTSLAGEFYTVPFGDGKLILNGAPI